MVKITTSQNIHLLYVGLLDYLKKVSPSPQPPAQGSHLASGAGGLRTQTRCRAGISVGTGASGQDHAPCPPPRGGEGLQLPSGRCAPRTDPCFGTPLSRGTVYLSGNLLFATSKGISWHVSELCGFSRMYFLAQHCVLPHSLSFAWPPGAKMGPEPSKKFPVREDKPPLSRPVTSSLLPLLPSRLTPPAPQQKRPGGSPQGP